RKVKILMLGDTGVGKSSLMNRFTEDEFFPGLVGTVGVDFKMRTLDLRGERVLVQVWDTAGQERFHKITRAYYRGSHGILLAYDVGEPATLENISYWINNIQDNASSGVCTCLVGNKMDLRGETAAAAASDNSADAAAAPPPPAANPLSCCVSASPKAAPVGTDSGRAIAQQYGVAFFETSAKTGHNVHAAFVSLVESALEAADAGCGPPTTPASQQRRRGARRGGSGGAGAGGDRAHSTPPPSSLRTGVCPCAMWCCRALLGARCVARVCSQPHLVTWSSTIF
ncbi:P-loop containing nucleoside triphosphate hydrolase protein, partial [Tribonema minus]